jgi:aryl-alcohol dehydrogenase-like predicted oxidoreductase
MTYRPLGKLQASIVGLGTGRLASRRGATRLEVEHLLDAARDSGINFIDTADSYASGECERWLGEMLRGPQRDHFLLATKAGYTFGDLPGPLSALNPFVKKALHLAGRRQNFSTTRLRACVEASLRRLRTDRIDFFFLHTPPPQVLAAGEAMSLLADLKREGKVRHFGVSSHDPAVLAAGAQAGAEVAQAPVNPQAARLPALGVPVIANQVFLSGKLLAGEDGAATVQARAGEIARRLETSARCVLLSYALAQEGVACALTGTTNVEHLRQNAGDARALAPLTPDDLACLSAPLA